MRQGESRHDGRHAPQCRSQARHRLATATAALIDRRNQQGDQEEYVVVTDPDMPDAGSQELQKPARGLGRATETLIGSADRKNRFPTGRTLPDDTGEAFMLQVNIEKQCVADVELTDGLGRIDRELRGDDVFAVLRAIAEALETQRQFLAVDQDSQSGLFVVLDLRLALLDLGPADEAVAVSVHFERTPQIQQLDLQLAFKMFAAHFERHERLAAGMRSKPPRKRERCQAQQPDQQFHGRLWFGLSRSRGRRCRRNSAGTAHLQRHEHGERACPWRGKNTMM